MGQLGQFITNHWALCLALVVVFLLILINEIQSQKKKAKELLPQAAVNLMNHNNAVVIDLRDADSFRKGHIINSVRGTIDDFEQGRFDKYKSQALILVCSRGLQSPALAAKLHSLGFSQPMVLSGGIGAWQSADLPLIKGK